MQVQSALLFLGTMAAIAALAQDRCDIAGEFDRLRGRLRKLSRGGIGLGEWRGRRADARESKVASDARNSANYVWVMKKAQPDCG
jgi:hypothetical protein